MKTLKFKAFRRIVKMREFCATADGEKTLMEILGITFVFLLTDIVLLIIAW